MGLASFLSGSILDIGVVTSALIGLVLTVIVLRMVKYRKYKLPPGPSTYPVIGNLLEMKGKEVHRLFAEWSKEHGPIISVYIGPELNIVLNNIEVVLEALVKKQNDFAGRPKSVTIDMMSDGGRSIVFGEGPLWKLHRKLSTKAIRKFMKGTSLEEKVHANFNIVGDMIKKKDEAIDPTRYIILLIINIICGVCFGHSYDFEDEEFIQISASFIAFYDGSLDTSGLFLEDYIPLLHRCPTKKFKNLSKNMKWFFNVIEKKLAQHRPTLNKENIRDLTDALLVAQAEEDLEEDSEDMSLLTDRHIVMTLSDVFAAGVDSTRLTIMYALRYMAAYPDIQTKVQEEINRVVDSDRLPRISDKENLPYTDAVIHEILRLHPIAPLAAPHKTMCDTSVGGYDIPRDTQVFINLWALHHDNEQWELVEEFLPDRFLDDNGKMAPKPQSWLPFSAGRRVCLGESVVKPELVLLLSCFMQKFKVRFPDGDSPDMTDNIVLLGLAPKPYKLIFEER